MDDNYAELLTDNSFRESKIGLLLESMAEGNEDGIRGVLDQIEWTPTAVESLQHSVINGEIVNFCSTGFNVSIYCVMSCI